MRALSITLALATSGCFSSWAITQAFGTQRILDEGVREQTVPLAGVEERLAVSIPLAIEYDLEPAVRDTSSPQAVAPQSKRERPFALTCSTKQYARDRVYHSAFRYGSRWKKMTGIAFLLEAALAATFLLLDDNRDTSDPMTANDRSGLLAGGFLAIDAIGTAAIFFIPRKEVFTVAEKAITTPIREDCPDGLALEIGGTSFPVDAAGRIGEIGEAALDDWMRAPSDAPGAPGGALALTFEGRAMPLRVTAREMCAWIRARHSNDVEGTACRTPGQLVTDLPRFAAAVMTVPTGSLSMAIEPATTTDSR